MTVVSQIQPPPPPPPPPRPSSHHEDGASAGRSNTPSQNMPSSGPLRAPTRERVSEAIALVRARQAAVAKNSVAKVNDVSDLKNLRTSIANQKSSTSSGGGSVKKLSNSPTDSSRSPLIPTGQTGEHEKQRKQPQKQQQPPPPPAQSHNFFQNVFASRSYVATPSSQQDDKSLPSAPSFSDEPAENSPQPPPPPVAAAQQGGLGGLAGRFEMFRKEFQLATQSSVASKSSSSSAAPKPLPPPTTASVASSLPANPSLDDEDDSIADNVTVDTKTMQDVNKFLDALNLKRVDHQTARTALVNGILEQQGSTDSDPISALRKNASDDFIYGASSDEMSDDSSVGTINPETLAEIGAYIDAVSKGGTFLGSNFATVTSMLDKSALPAAPQSPAKVSSAAGGAKSQTPHSGPETNTPPANDNHTTKLDKVVENIPKTKEDAPTFADPDITETLSRSSKKSVRIADKVEVVFVQQKDTPKAPQNTNDLASDITAQTRVSEPSPIYEQVAAKSLAPGSHKDPPAVIKSHNTNQVDPPAPITHNNKNNNKNSNWNDAAVMRLHEGQQAVAPSYSADSLESGTLAVEQPMMEEEKKTDDASESESPISHMVANRHARLGGVVESPDDTPETEDDAEVESTQNADADDFDDGHDDEPDEEDQDNLGATSAESDEEFQKVELVDEAGVPIRTQLATDSDIDVEDGARNEIMERYEAVEAGNSDDFESEEKTASDVAHPKVEDSEDDDSDDDDDDESVDDTRSEGSDVVSELPPTGMKHLPKSPSLNDSDSLPWELRDIASEETMKAAGRTRAAALNPASRSKARKLTSLLSDDTSVQNSMAMSRADSLDQASESGVSQVEDLGLNQFDKTTKPGDQGQVVVEEGDEGVEAVETSFVEDEEEEEAQEERVKENFKTPPATPRAADPIGRVERSIEAEEPIVKRPDPDASNVSAVSPKRKSRPEQIKAQQTGKATTTKFPPPVEPVLSDTASSSDAYSASKFDEIDDVEEDEAISAFLSRFGSLHKGGHFPDANVDAIQDFLPSQSGSGEEAVEIDAKYGFVNKRLEQQASEEVSAQEQVEEPDSALFDIEDEDDDEEQDLSAPSASEEQDEFVEEDVEEPEDELDEEQDEAEEQDDEETEVPVSEQDGNNQAVYEFLEAFPSEEVDLDKGNDETSIIDEKSTQSEMFSMTNYESMDPLDEDEAISAFLTRFGTLHKGGHFPGANVEAIKDYMRSTSGSVDENVELDATYGFVKKDLIVKSESPVEETNSVSLSIKNTESDKFSLFAASADNADEGSTGPGFLEQFESLEVEEETEGESNNSDNEVDAVGPAVAKPSYDLFSISGIVEYFESLDDERYRHDQMHLEKIRWFKKLVAPVIGGSKPSIIESAQIRQAALVAKIPLDVVDRYLDMIDVDEPAIPDILSSQSEAVSMTKYEDIEDLNEDEAISAFLTRFGTLHQGGHFPDANIQAVRDYVDEEEGGEEAVEIDATYGYVNKKLQIGESAEEEEEEQEWWKEGQQNQIEVGHVQVMSTESGEWKSSSEEHNPENSGKIVPVPSDPDLIDLTGDAPRAPRAAQPAIQKESSTPYNAKAKEEALIINTKFSASNEEDDEVWLRRKAMAKYGAAWEKHANWLSPRTTSGINKPGTVDGVAAAENLNRFSYSKRLFKNLQPWKRLYKERTQFHPGFYDVDVHSIYESTNIAHVEYDENDYTPWEHREVKQRFLHEKSYSFSRNWFGDLARRRGNDKIKLPVCKPKSMEMPIENIPDPGEWTEEWFTQWKAPALGAVSSSRSMDDYTAMSYADRTTFTDYDGTNRGSFTEDGSTVRNPDDDFSSSASSGSGSERSEDDDDDTWEEAPECGELINVKQRIGERITRVHYNYTSSLRRSRWRKKYFPRGTFPY